MALVTMRYWAAAKEAAGVAEQQVAADTLAAALAAVGPSARLSAVLARSSFLIDGQPVGTRAAEAIILADGAIVEVLPPFAGG